MSGKYNSARDEILHALCIAEWSNESFGDVSEYGLFAWRIELSWVDLTLNNTEFNSIFDEIVKDNDIALTGKTRSELLGNFVVWTNEQGFVYVIDSPDAKALFDGMRKEYEAWSQMEAQADGMDMTDWGHERDYPLTD